MPTFTQEEDDVHHIVLVGSPWRTWFSQHSWLECVAMFIPPIPIKKSKVF